MLLTNHQDYYKEKKEKKIGLCLSRVVGCVVSPKFTRWYSLGSAQN